MGIHLISVPAIFNLQPVSVAKDYTQDAMTATTMTFKSDGVGGDIREGDIVDVPGAMHGVVRFIGSVKGKNGVFAGVELSREYAARGKNDGDVDGIRYFQTSVPGSGIFLPIHRATRRSSLHSSGDPLTPPTPSYAPVNHIVNGKSSASFTPSRPAVSKFSQSVGPGARARSPPLKPRTSRPSLPRPESPIRKQASQQTSSQTTPRGASAGLSPFSRSAIGPPRLTPSPAPPRFGSIKSRTPIPPRPFLRSTSRPSDQAAIDKSAESTPTGRPRPSGSLTAGPKPCVVPTVGHSEDESRRLMKEIEERGRRLEEVTKELEERDRRLKEQASSLAEMESSLAELQSLMAANGTGSARKDRDFDDDGEDAHQLRALLREKNEKIAMMTAEFDAHRADFRSTIDALEMASTETERVYEKRVEELLQEIKELQDQIEDVESVAKQLKQLEDLVQELEEGLEDARRGEAEARTEVEFLRGEVERGRSEHRREMDQKDDEIRGLKAIIYSLSSGKDHMAGQSKREGSPMSPPPELWCEICETAGHDILTCNIADPSPQTPKVGSPGALGSPPKGPLPSPPQEKHVAGNSGSGAVDMEKWCALCERDGHDSISCPFEDTM